MATEIKIYIDDRTKRSQIVARVATGLIITMAPISIGILCGSAAMQWLGFVLGFIALLGLSTKTANAQTFASITEVRAYLDKLEARS